MMRVVLLDGWAARAALACVALVSGWNSAAGATPAKVDEAIAKAKKYLYSKEKNGNWEGVTSRQPGVIPPNSPNGLQYGGTTALATFALLSSGEDPSKNDQLRAAVKFLEKADIRGTYALGLRAQVWNLVPEDDDVKTARHRDAKLLMAGVREGQDEATGFFGYGEGMPAEQYDHSVSQFGVLGLWSLDLAGEEINNHFWRDFDKAWKSHQHPNGSWGYLWHDFEDTEESRGIGSASLSMTAAGVATLFITQDFVNAGGKCGGNVKDPNIEAGMKWIGANFKAIGTTPWAVEWQYYTLFGICRIGLASGYKVIGNTDWFQWGSDRLIKSQGADGSWEHGELMLAKKGDAFGTGVWDTGLALLFLSRGSGAIAFNKLQYFNGPGKKPVEGFWNERPRDVANLTRYLGKLTEVPNLGWQIVNLQERPEDLLDAPLLYMSGSQLLKIAPADQLRLKNYVEQGGIIIGHADCGSAAFAETFRKMGEAMFPGEKFAPLPADHPIFRNEAWPAKNWSPAPKIEAVTNGARVLMLLLPAGDPGKDWQTQAFVAIKKYPVGQLMLNVLLYATDLNVPRTKGQTWLVQKDPAVTAAKTIKVARLQYAGNWNPEPLGWARLGNILHNTKKVDLDVTDVELGKGKLTNDYKLADLTGTAEEKFTDAQLAELAAYVAGGGTLLIDSAGGKSDFATAIEADLGKIAPGAAGPLDVLPLDSPVYADGGDPVKTAGYRRFAKPVLGTLRTPQLRGLVKGGRVVVIFSKEDIAVGLVGQQVDGIVGYDPDSAVKVAGSVVLYAGE
jgi:hypothetical protein